MAILDQYGSPILYSRKFNRSAENNAKDRPWVPTKLDNIDKLIPSYDRNVLVAVSRMLVENWSPARAISRQIPMYAVRKAYVPSLETSDEPVKKQVETTLRESFLNMVDFMGRDFNTFLYHIAHLKIRDGEVFYLLSEWETGFPAIQIIPCHRVGQRQMGTVKITKGAYKGLEICEGVIRNRYGVPVAYRVLGETEKDDEDISARSLKHVNDSDYPEALRGYPEMTHGLNDGRDALQAHEWERLNMLARSSHTLLEWNESGTPENTPRQHFDTDHANLDGTQARELETKQLEGGTWKYFRAGSGSKLEAVKHETPGEVWESFQDRLVWKVCAGVPWPVSFVKGDYGRGGGPSERRDIMQAQQTVEDMQSILDKVARNILGYAYKKMVALDMLPDSPDWWRWTFSHPPNLTIDDGRSQKAMLDMWRAGIIADDDMLVALGKDPSEYWRNKFNAAADKEILFAEIQESKGVTLDPRYKGMFNMNEMAPVETEEPETEKKDQQDEDEEQD